MFNIGERVLINPKSWFYNQGEFNPGGVTGTVTHIDYYEVGDEYWVTVKFDNGVRNVYPNEEVLLADPTGVPMKHLR